MDASFPKMRSAYRRPQRCLGPNVFIGQPVAIGYELKPLLNHLVSDRTELRPAIPRTRDRVEAAPKKEVQCPKEHSMADQLHRHKDVWLAFLSIDDFALGFNFH